jgi:hypothetical protein
MRAALAIAHKILVSAYHMLANGLAFRDLGEAYLDQISQNPHRRQPEAPYRTARLSRHAPANRGGRLTPIFVSGPSGFTFVFSNKIGI